MPTPTSSRVLIEHSDDGHGADLGSEPLKSATIDLLRKWPVSGRVNSSRANDEDTTLIDRVELARAD